VGKRRKPAKKKGAPKRIDWGKKKAPKPGSKLRAKYEKSAVYRRRRESAQKGQKTRRKHVKAEQRRLLKQERRDLMKERLGPLLGALVADWKSRRSWADTRESHANWYKAKLDAEDDFGSGADWERVLEDLSDEYDLDTMGWDILY
jgi:hypothetical protein